MYGGIRALPFNLIIYIDDWTMIEALMCGEINATAAMYNMAGVAGNGFAYSAPWYLANVNKWLNMARKLYSWKFRWVVNGKVYYNREEAEHLSHPDSVKEEENDYYNPDLLKEIEESAKAEENSCGQDKDGTWLDGSIIGGGPIIKKQYDFECFCITNMYGKQWTK